MFVHDVRTYDPYAGYAEADPKTNPEQAQSGRQVWVSKTAAEVLKDDLPNIQKEGFEILSAFPYGVGIAVVLKKELNVAAKVTTPPPPTTLYPEGGERIEVKPKQPAPKLAKKGGQS